MRVLEEHWALPIFKAPPPPLCCNGVGLAVWISGCVNCTSPHLHVNTTRAASPRDLAWPGTRPARLGSRLKHLNDLGFPVSHGRSADGHDLWGKTPVYYPRLRRKGFFGIILSKCVFVSCPLIQCVQMCIWYMQAYIQCPCVFVCVRCVYTYT